MPVGVGSVTVVPAALTLPVLLATIVYTIVPFGVSVVAGVLFWILTCGTGGTVTVLLHGGGVLFGVHRPPLGGVAVAVFVTVAGGVEITVAVTVYVTVLPAGKVARFWFKSPLPEAVGQTAPPLAAQVHV